MKNIEYFYNVLYYFFYRGAIKMFKGIDFILYPFRKLILFIIDIPFIRYQYTKRGITNPEEMADKRLKKITENPKFSLATMIGGGMSMSVFGFTYLGLYHIIKNIFFPTFDFEDSDLYALIVIVILGFVTGVALDGKSEKYIKEFNKKKGWWRVKWSIITTLLPFIVMWFLFSTSHGMINRYLLSLSGNYTYPTAKEKLEQENQPVKFTDENRNYINK